MKDGIGTDSALYEGSLDEGGFRQRKTVDFPLALQDAWLLLETIDTRLALLNMSEQAYPYSPGGYHQRVRVALEQQRTKLSQACEKLINVLPVPPLFVKESAD